MVGSGISFFGKSKIIMELNVWTIKSRELFNVQQNNGEENYNDHVSAFSTRLPNWLNESFCKNQLKL